MAKATNTAQIIKKIGCPHLNLYRGQGYYYFSFDDESRGLYDTKSIAACYLTQLELDMWVEDGKAFVEQMEAEYIERQELAKEPQSRFAPKS